MDQYREKLFNKCKDMLTIFAVGPFHSYFSLQTNQTIQLVNVLLTFSGLLNLHFEFGLYLCLRYPKAFIPT